jgi:putative flippase GtrA
MGQIQGLSRSPIVGQAMRFLVAGGITTVLYTAVYLPLAMWGFGRERAVLAVPFAFAVAVTAGFWLHSNWSFRGHGTRQDGAGQRLKFVGVQGSGLLMHAAITWIVTDRLGLPAWAPLIPGLILVPVVTFFLNRQWVFR